MEVLLQNVHGNFGSEKLARKLIGSVRRRRPGFAAYPEAVKDGEGSNLDLIREDFSKAGYVTAFTWYEDADGRPDRNGILTAVRKDLVTRQAENPVIRLATRNALRQWLIDPDTGQEVQAIGGHLDDRSEKGRRVQARALRSYVLPPALGSTVIPSLVEIDANASRLRDTWKSGRIQAARLGWLAAQVPGVPNDPPTGGEMRGLGRTMNKLARAGEMTVGSTMRILEEGDLLHDVAPDNQPTFPADNPFMRIDHILATRHFRADDFEVANNGMGDHCELWARLIFSAEWV